MLAFARPVAVAQGGKDADGRVHPAHHIGDTDPDLHRFGIGCAGQ